MIIELGSVTERTRGFPETALESDRIQPGPESVL